MTTGTAVAPMRALRTVLEPFRGLRSMNRLLEEAFGPAASTNEESFDLWAPPCDIYETDNELVVQVELPGVKKEDVKVSIENNVLTISGERKFEEETKRENYRRAERSYGQFMRSFILPNTVDTDKVSAEFKDGVLRVGLPKREESKPKAVEVKVA